MRLRHLLAGLCIVVFATACGSTPPPTGPGPIVTPPPAPIPLPQPPPPTPAPTLAITRILSFGDSLTAGTTSPTFTPFALSAGLPQSYPFKLQALAGSRYSTQALEISNGGVAGEQATWSTTHPRLARLMSEARPELLILMEGANDLNNIPPDSTNVSPVVAAMEDMVKDARGRGVQVMVATIPPQRPGGKGNAGALLAKYNNELKLMASKKDAMLVDINALVPLSMIGQDGLHPTEAGYQLIAEIFLDAIKARYEVVTTVRR
jgi:lysophospholipase L1-like esterase